MHHGRSSFSSGAVQSPCRAPRAGTDRARDARVAADAGNVAARSGPASLWHKGTAQQEIRIMARKYGRKASEKVEKAMHERKRGTLRSGRSGKVILDW